MAGYLREVDIKSDMPTADLAVRRVTFNIKTSKQLGAAAIKFIHGYGSTGRGGAIRIRTRRYLEELLRSRQIRGYIIGENFSIFDEATRRAFELCDELRRDPDIERHNNGITIVIL
jgi:hypothetical protein